MKKFFAATMIATLLGLSGSAALAQGAPATPTTTIVATPASPGTATTPVNMGESFAKPTFQELTHTMMMLGGMDVSEPRITEEYAKLMFCDLWRQNHNNDFNWQKIRDLVISRAQSKKDYYRIQYQMEGPVQLGKYDFNTQDFPLTADTALNRVGSIVLLEYDIHAQRAAMEKGVHPLCDDTAVSSVFPTKYVFFMNQPFTFDRLKMDKDDAKQLLDKMDAAKNVGRQLYVRFRFRVQSVERLDSAKIDPQARVSMHGELASADVFLDYAMTKYLTSVPIK